MTKKEEEEERKTIISIIQLFGERKRRRRISQYYMKLVFAAFDNKRNKKLKNLANEAIFKINLSIINFHSTFVVIFFFLFWKI